MKKIWSYVFEIFLFLLIVFCIGYFLYTFSVVEV